MDEALERRDQPPRHHKRRDEDVGPDLLDREGEGQLGGNVWHIGDGEGDRVLAGVDAEVLHQPRGLCVTDVRALVSATGSASVRKHQEWSYGVYRRRSKNLLPES